MLPVANFKSVYRATVAVITLLCVCVDLAAAQVDTGNAAPSLEQLQRPFIGDEPLPAASADLIAWSSRLESSPTKPGDTFKTAVVVEISEGWHINAHRPLQPFLIGTELAVEPHPEMVVSDLRYPEPRLLRFAFAEDELAVLEGTVPIFLSVRTSAEMPAGRDTLRASLRVQACNDQVCLRPSNIAIEIPVEAAADGSGSGVDPFFRQYDGTSSSGNRIGDLFANRGALIAFLSIFVIGLALNLTPCVYPMLSVTVSLFGGQHENQAGRAFGRASLYVLGIVTMYSVLGMVAAFTGGLFGSWLQSAWVLGAIGLLLIALAAGMFGLYEIRLPAALTTRLGTAHRVAGPLGLYFSGLVVGVFAAPCIGPPIVALLAFVGSRGDPFFGFSAFAVLSLGLGAPYLVLGTFSSLLSKLPRSGMWMVWVKRVFALVLIGAGLFYLGLAAAPAYAAYAVPIALVGGGVYLALATRSIPGVRQWVGWTAGAAAILVGVMAFNNLQRPGVEWSPYSPGSLVEATASGKPVVLDFYADWCIPCLELDRVTFTDPGVVAALDEFARLKVDLTPFDSPESEALRRQFEVAGVPTVVFLDESGGEVETARVVGFVNPETFLSRLTLVNELEKQTE